MSGKLARTLRSGDVLPLSGGMKVVVDSAVVHLYNNDLLSRVDVVITYDSGKHKLMELHPDSYVEVSQNVDDENSDENDAEQDRMTQRLRDDPTDVEAQRFLSGE